MDTCDHPSRACGSGAGARGSAPSTSGGERRAERRHADVRRPFPARAVQCAPECLYRWLALCMGTADGFRFALPAAVVCDLVLVHGRHANGRFLPTRMGREGEAERGEGGKGEGWDRK